MLATVITVVGTRNLALGVGIGVLLSGIFFAWKVAQIFRVTSSLTADGQERTYLFEGQLFFASADDFMAAFDFKEAVRRVRIDLSRAHIWDLTGVNAVDRAVLKFRREDVEVEVVGLNEASTTIMDKLAVHNDPKAMEKVFGH
jgi:SulP family sulfate permease